MNPIMISPIYAGASQLAGQAGGMGTLVRSGGLELSRAASSGMTARGVCGDGSPLRSLRDDLPPPMGLLVLCFGSGVAHGCRSVDIEEQFFPPVKFFVA
jgi:hypothetical protein